MPRGNDILGIADISPPVSLDYLDKAPFAFASQTIRVKVKSFSRSKAVLSASQTEAVM